MIPAWWLVPVIIMWVSTLIIAGDTAWSLGRDKGRQEARDARQRPALPAGRHAASAPRLLKARPTFRARVRKAAAAVVWLQRDHPTPPPIRIDLIHKRPPTAELMRLCHASDELFERLVPRETIPDLTAAPSAPALTDATAKEIL